MKLSGLALSPLLLTAVCPLVAVSSLTAQTSKSSTTTMHHKTASAEHTSSAACAELPPLSPKIPALPAGSPCAKPLFTIATVPNIKFDYVAPIASETGLAEVLGMESNKITENYIDYKVGTGALAGAHKFYTINYTGYLVDGTKFDSSYDRKEPITIPYGQHKVVIGWDTGFDGMRVGGKRRLFIPWQLGYGPNQHDAIPGKSMMIFDVELMAISETDPTPPRPLPPAALQRQQQPAPKPAAPAAASPVTPPVSTPVKPATPPATTPKP